MQKTKILCLILAVVLASAGTVTFALNLSDETEAPIIPDNAVDTVMDKPVGEMPSDRTAIENLYIAQGELQRKGGFVGTTKGTAVSAGIAQNVYNNRTVIDGNAFKEMITIGVVKNAYQLYITDTNFLYRKFDSIKSADDIKWADTAARYSEEDFLLKFGHCSNKLTGYILNDDTIVSGVLEKEENGLYTYRYVLDTKTAPARMLYEMKTNSNMSGYSTFSKAEIIVTMDADWQVKTLSTDCKYKVPMFGGIDCVEDCTETFSDLTTDTLPETDFFKQFFNADLERPVDEEATALNVLMDMFAPYASGNNLNVSLDAAMDGQTVLTGMLSAKIDIENISNIEVAARLGDDMFIEYQQGLLYVTYQDFKASTSVDGIMGVVSALMPSTDNDGEQSDDILSKFTYKVENGLCTVNLPLTVGGEELNVNIYANVVDDKYEFRNAEVTLGGLRIAIEPISEFNVPARQGEYPEILGLLDIVQNGVIYGSVNALGMDVDVMFDIATTSLYATSGDLAITYKNETVYAELGALKAKIAIDDIEAMISLLRMAGVIEGSSSIELPQISLEALLATLNNVKATATSDGVAFTLTTDGLAAAIYLTATDNGWSLDKLTAEFGGNVITVALTAPALTEMPAVDENDYADVYEIISTFLEPLVSLAQSDRYGASFALALTIDGAVYNVEGNVAYDSNRNLSLAATVSNSAATLIKANVAVVDGIVYLDINNLKAAFAADELGGDVDIKQLVQSVYGANDSIDGIIEAVYGIIDNAMNLDLSTLDFASIIKQFDFSNGTIALTVNADFVGLGDIDVALSVGKRGSLVVGLGGLQLGSVTLDAQATITTKVNAIAAPDAADYVLTLAGSVEDVEFAVSANLLDMDVSARINALGQTVLARYVDGKVYATVGEVAIVATPDRLGALVNEIMSKLGITDVNFDGMPNVDLSVKALLDAITLNLASATPSVGIDIEGLASVSVNFDNNANFVSITATVMDKQLNVVKSDEQVPQLDLSKVYIPVEPLAAQMAEIYANYKDVLSSGIALNLAANIIVNGSAYVLTAQVNYNNGLYLNANVVDGATALLAADVYLVDNVLYLDINGVRLATELPNANTNANVSVETVFGMLAQAKGYNEVLDSVLDVVIDLPNKLDGINYLDLLGALSYDNDVLSATINGEMLGIGISNFDVTLEGAYNVVLTLSNLTIGYVTIANVAVNAVPACSEVTAPTSEYVTELEIDVMGITATAKLDLLNKSVTATAPLLNKDLSVYYADGIVYVKYDGVKAKLGIDQIDRLIAVINMFKPITLPQTSLDVDVKEILNSVALTRAEDGYKVAIAIAGVNAEVAFGADAKLSTVTVTYGDVEVKATRIDGAAYPAFDTSEHYDDLVSVIEAYATQVRSLMDANGYGVTLNGSFAFDNHVYDVTANVNYNNGLYVNANVAYNGNNMLDVELWLVDNVLYAQLGDTRLAINIANGDTAQNGGNGNAIDLSKFNGYNTYVDGILDVIQGAIDKLTSNNVDYASLIGGIGYKDGILSLVLNGEELGLSQLTVRVSANDGITATVSNLVIDSLTANVNASVAASNSAVTAPQGDFTTNLRIKIDDANVVYANLDLINKVYNFKLDDMYIRYSDGVIKVNKNDIYVSADFDRIVALVKRVDDLVNEFSGSDKSTAIKLDMSKFQNVDVKAIVNSLTIANVGKGVALGVDLFGYNVNVNLAYGALSSASVYVGLIKKTVEVTPCDKQSYVEFGDDVNYIAIDKVLEDYFPVIEKLVHTNSWVFNFDGDTLLSIGKDVYKVAAGSYLEFYYKNTDGFDTFKLRAKLDVHKQREDGTWQPFMNLDIVYKDGTIYVTDKGRLVDGKKETDRNTIRIKVDVSTLIRCYDLYDKIVAVVPQIGELVDKVFKAKKEAEGNAAKISYSTLLTDARYVGGVFGLTLNAKALLSKLDAISLSAQTYGKGLSLNSFVFTYDTISLHVSNLRVCASEATEVDDELKYAAVDDINAYEFDAYHMDFNSLYELLSSFVKTATPPDSSGTRTFFLSGNVDVDLSFIGDLGLNMVSIDLAARVDITADNITYLTIKVSHGNNRLVFKDYGADSYLYFDGSKQTVSVIRNSQDKLFGKKGVTYNKSDMSLSEFSADMITYIFEMIHFSDAVQNTIDKNINKEQEVTDYGIEDVFKDYSYTQSSKTYAVSADLSPINKNLGKVNLNILHGDDYKLTSLNGNIELASVIKAKIDLKLNDSKYKDATNYVQNKSLW